MKIQIANSQGLLEEVLKLDKRTFPEDDRVNLKNAVFFLAYDEAQSKYVGYGGIVLIDEVWYLRRAGVIKKARGKGVQRMLINARVAYATRYRKDYPILTYTVVDNSQSAYNLIACGFSPYWPTNNLFAGDKVNYWLYKAVQPGRRTLT